MKNQKFWWALIVFLIAWSAFEIYPPTSRDLIEYFAGQVKSGKGDAAFLNIVKDAKAMQKKDPGLEHEFDQLRAAIGTNNIQPYFNIDVHDEENPTYAILNQLQQQASGKIKLGLDLQGGIQFMVQLRTDRITAENGTNTPKTTTDREAELKRLTDQAVEVLRKRVDRLGVAEPVIQPAGPGMISIQLPGLSQSVQDDAQANIQKAAYLEFCIVHPDSEKLLKEGTIEPGYRVMREKMKQPDGTFTYAELLVEKKPVMTGKYITRAYASRDPVMGTPEILFELNSEGADIFYQVTKEYIHQRMGIVLDGVLQSAPVIQSAIPGGHGVITGNFTVDEALNLASVLENPLETPVEIISSQQVDPTLGADTISSGWKSALAGTLLVAAFMAMYYHRCGVIANVAMVTNLIILVGVMCSIGTTLTLPGIAGVVLTVGMAVDANVLIYERLREEMALGKSMRGSIAAAYSRAFKVIFDSHTTTLISSVILIYTGTGPIKGFGVTLTIGVALSLFTALVVTRLIFEFLLGRGMLNKVGMMHWIKNWNIDFMRYAKPAFITSWTIIAIGIGWGFHRGKDVEGIEFAGGNGVRMTYDLNRKVNVDDIRKTIQPYFGETRIQYQSGAQQMLEVITGFKPEGAKGVVNTNATVVGLLNKAFPDSKFDVKGYETVGPTVGDAIQKSAVIAVFLSLFGILFYVALRYEFSFSVGAVVAVIHDVLMTIGIYFLAGKQLSAPMVAAVLTIIGFSINDTIVIFDRIREDLKLGIRGTFKEVMNKALNQTLSRTVITSGTVFLSTMALFLWGGAGIEDFSFTFLFGIITGTYSSIYIASALVLWWHKGERPKMAAPTAAETPAEIRARA
jgi:SecD/SecF fusion protein